MMDKEQHVSLINILESSVDVSSHRDQLTLRSHSNSVDVSIYLLSIRIGRIQDFIKQSIVKCEPGIVVLIAIMGSSHLLLPSDI